MRRLILAAALSSALALSGCALPGGGNAALIEQARSIATTVCAFLPTVETVVGILNLGNPMLQSADAIASAICAALNRPGVYRGRVVEPSVQGVPVRGRRLR